MKQIRVALIHNGLDSSAAYADAINAQLTDEAVCVSVQDPRPIRLALPIRAVPNVAVILFADTLEAGQEVVSVLRQLDLIKKQDEVGKLVDELITAADPLPPVLAEKIINIYYGGDGA